MSPDVAAAIPALERAQVLAPGPAARLLRIARGELVSVRAELKALLYVGVVLVTAGVSVLVGENLDRLGPVTIAVGLGLASAACLGWVFRRGAAFTWGEVADPHLALDYLLVLAIALASADLAYIETKFTPLGQAWTWHLLFIALAATALAFRFDSKPAFSLGLVTFASWRGVATSVTGLGESLVEVGWLDVQVNQIGCGVLFVVLGFALRRSGRKAHFEPVATYLGWVVLLGALASGLDGEQAAAVWWSLLLLVVAAGLGTLAFRARRFPLFAIGLLAAYVGLSSLFFRAAEPGDIGGAFWFLLSSGGLLYALLRARSRMVEPA